MPRERVERVILVNHHKTQVLATFEPRLFPQLRRPEAEFRDDPFPHRLSPNPLHHTSRMALEERLPHPACLWLLLCDPLQPLLPVVKGCRFNHPHQVYDLTLPPGGLYQNNQQLLPHLDDPHPAHPQWLLFVLPTLHPHCGGRPVHLQRYPGHQDHLGLLAR